MSSSQHNLSSAMNTLQAFVSQKSPLPRSNSPPPQASHHQLRHDLASDQKSKSKDIVLLDTPQRVDKAPWDICQFFSPDEKVSQEEFKLVLAKVVQRSDTEPVSKIVEGVYPRNAQLRSFYLNASEKFLNCLERVQVKARIGSLQRCFGAIKARSLHQAHVNTLIEDLTTSFQEERAQLILVVFYPGPAADLRNDVVLGNDGWPVYILGGNHLVQAAKTVFGEDKILTATLYIVHNLQPTTCMALLDVARVHNTVLSTLEPTPWETYTAFRNGLKDEIKTDSNSVLIYLRKMSKTLQSRGVDSKPNLSVLVPFLGSSDRVWKLLEQIYALTPPENVGKGQKSKSKKAKKKNDLEEEEAEAEGSQIRSDLEGLKRPTSYQQFSSLGGLKEEEKVMFLDRVLSGTLLLPDLKDVTDLFKMKKHVSVWLMYLFDSDKVFDLLPKLSTTLFIEKGKSLGLMKVKGFAKCVIAVKKADSPESIRASSITMKNVVFPETKVDKRDINEEVLKQAEDKANDLALKFEAVQQFVPGNDLKELVTTFAMMLRNGAKRSKLARQPQAPGTDVEFLDDGRTVDSFRITGQFAEFDFAKIKNLSFVVASSTDCISSIVKAVPNASFGIRCSLITIGKIHQELTAMKPTFIETSVFVEKGEVAHGLVIACFSNDQHPVASELLYDLRNKGYVFPLKVLKRFAPKDTVVLEIGSDSLREFVKSAHNTSYVSVVESNSLRESKEGTQPRQNPLSSSSSSSSSSSTSSSASSTLKGATSNADKPPAASPSKDASSPEPEVETTVQAQQLPIAVTRTRISKKRAALGLASTASAKKSKD